MPDEPETPPETPDLVAAIRALKDTIVQGAAWTDSSSRYARAGYNVYYGSRAFIDLMHCLDGVISGVAQTSTTLTNVAAGLAAIIAAIPAGYDFDAWAKDLGDKSTPEAKELGKGILTALDILLGAYEV